ncbi:MAG: 3-keto-5-aminohexanoate cleavage protein [Deltaproteobacteria bacterium]|nr:MAG: 3-keto-5-aminohexanoate cleavage protein [Deltaproteobacteria bacterium]
MEKLIVSAAITGSTTVPSQTPHLPITPKQIAVESARAAESGAAVAHIHARDSKTGAPTSSLEIFEEIINRIKDKSNIIINTTTGGGVGMSIEERVAVVARFKPEMASFNMGSINFGLFPVARKIKEFKYPWEKKYLESTKDFVFRNTFFDLEHICQTMKNNKVKPELEMYDVGQLYNAAYLLKEKFLDPPLHMQYVMGVLGGIGATLNDLMYMKETSDRLYGKDKYTWSVIGVGYPREFHLAAQTIMMGGHVRVGLEDNIYISKGVLTESNAQLVEKVVRIARELDREIASPDEARKILGLK